LPRKAPNSLLRHSKVPFRRSLNPQVSIPSFINVQNSPEPPALAKECINLCVKLLCQRVSFDDHLILSVVQWGNLIIVKHHPYSAALK